VDLVIARSEGIVSIDNQPLAVDTSPLASNIELLAYDCTSGAGNLEYNDRLRVLESFGDITPYAAFVNSWMTTAAAITAMPLTLAQAKRVKIGLVDGIFNSKRQLPITTQGQTWDATDQSLMGMQSAIAAFDVVAAMNASDASIASQVNTMGITTSTQTQTQTQTATQTAVGGISYGVATVSNVPNVVVAPIGNPTASSASQSNSQSTSQSSSVHTSISPPAASPPNIPWPPLNSTTTVSLTQSNMRALINSIQQRRGSLQSTRLSKTNAINSMTTVAAIIAYDATTGWPF
jgi:hypothetical protein